MTPAAIRARIAELEAIKSAAAASDAHNADTVWAVAEGEIRELLWQNVTQAAERARRLEEAGLDCTQADDDYMAALFDMHDFNFQAQERAS